MQGLPTAFCCHCQDVEILFSRLRGGRLVRFCLSCDEPVDGRSEAIRYRPEAVLADLGFSFAEPPPPLDEARSCGSGGCGSSCGCATGGGCATCSKVDTCHKIH